MLVRLNVLFDLLLDFDLFRLSPPDVAVSLVESGQSGDGHPGRSASDIELVVTSSNVDVPHANSVPSPDTKVLNVELLIAAVAIFGDGGIEHVVSIAGGVVSSTTNVFV